MIPVPAGPLTDSTGTRISRVPVSPLFWLALSLIAGGMALGSGLGQSLPIAAAAVLMLLGGLPHGAYDIAIARHTLGMGWARATLALLAYIAVALAMIALWAIAPLYALAVFLMLAAIHFGEDWLMIETGLLRVMAGASIICVPAFFRGPEVTALFTTMAGPGAETLQNIAVACTPVALLVNAVGTLQTWRAGHREWATAQTIALITLATTPPQIGFMLYFVFLHAPLHMRGLGTALPDWSPTRIWAYGAIICVITLAAGALIAPGFLSGDIKALSAESFRLLSVVAAPHLLLTTILKQATRGHPHPTSRFSKLGG